MSASPVLVTNNPRYLTARSLVYTAHDLRRSIEDTVGPGVTNRHHFHVHQRGVGANMSVDVGLSSDQLNIAYVKWPLDYLDRWYGIYQVDYAGTQLNVDVPTADPSNPRIDSVFLVVEDSQVVGANNRATIRYVAGTPTAGATLANRTGAPTPPTLVAWIRLADILVGTAVASITDANIRDRRPWGVRGYVPPFGGRTFDAVMFEPVPGLPVNTVPGAGALSATNHGNKQSAALMYLPADIRAVDAEFGYVQGGTANVAVNSLVVAIYDTAGSLLVASAGITPAGTAANPNRVSLAGIEYDFYRGYYYVAIGVGAMTASSEMVYPGVAMSQIYSAGIPGGKSGYGLGLRRTSGGTSLPNDLSAFADVNSLTVAEYIPPVPILQLQGTF